MEKNDVFTIRIDDINNLGYGVGHIANPDGSRGITVFTAGGVTGDKLSVTAIKVNKDYIVARIKSIIKPSDRRIENNCTAAGCGGCIYRNISYEYELELKRLNVRNSFERAGIHDAVIDPVQTTGMTERYRNKAQYPVGNGKNGMLAGFYANNSHRIAQCDDCVLQPEEFAGIVRFICGFCDKKSIMAYDEETKKGLLRHIFIRKASVTEKIAVCLVINGKKIPGEPELIAGMTAAFPSVTSITLNENKADTNVVLGDKFRTLYGDDYIEDVLCGLKLRISAGSFYQVNHDACELLYGIAKQKADLSKDDTIIDLYCGIGSIGLSMADAVKRNVGIEIIPEAVICAKENAELNGIKNSYFYCGDASDAGLLLENAEQNLGSLDGATIIMDPPRKGSTPELISYIASRNFKKVVYISCNPDTLARDCALFRALGYTMSSVTPVNLFPRTSHCESICLLSRK